VYEGRYEMNPTRLGNFIIDVEAQADRLLLRFSHRQQLRFVATTRADDFVDVATRRIHLDFTRDADGKVTALTLRDVRMTYYSDPENNITSRIVKGGADVTGKRVVLPAPNKAGNTTFKLKGYASARIVTLAGSFNNWHQSRVLFERDGDEWVCRIDLSPGTHTYKFVVDGTWITDPANPKTEADEFGNTNSVVVKEP